jgi:outer membrane protein OmpA-like peptidoglycan-associated protein
MKMDHKDDEAFWPSYVDLMTSLFVIMLVLFVFSFAAYSVKQRQLLVEAKNWERMKQIDASIGELAHSNQFAYDPIYNRYVFKTKVQFDTGDYTIKPIYNSFLIEGGKSINDLVKDLKSKQEKDPAMKNIRYLVIIEGMASKDSYPDNFSLSYKRAHALYLFWQENNIVFDNSICEVMIVGSGIGGVGRSVNEADNQRFLIQIVPKVTYQN